MISIMAFIFGAVAGSTGSALAYRLPRGLPVGLDRSRCPRCGHQLPWYENVPIVSYFALRGRCRGCRGEIALTYVGIEIVLGAIFVGETIRHGVTLETLALWVSATVAGIAIQTDLEFRRIPNKLTYGGLGIIGAIDLARGVTTTSFDSVVGVGLGALAVGAALLLASILSRGGFGLGDVKLATMFALALMPLGYRSVIDFLVCAFFLGSVVGVALIVTKRANRKSALPFAPFLAVGFLAVSLAFV